MDLSKTLFVTDMDGTLLNRRAKLSETSARSLNELMGKGVSFTVATARSWDSASPILKDLKLTLPAVTYNGAFLVLPQTGEAIASHIFEQKEIDFLRDCFRDAGVYPLVYAKIDGASRVSWIKGMETDGIRKYLAERIGDPRLRGVGDYEALTMGEVFYFTAIGSKASLSHLERDLRENSMFQTTFQEDVYITDEYWLEIMHSNATKAKGVAEIKERFGFERVICFGDNINDIPMFQLSDEGYAVENAHPRLIELASGTIPSCDKDGVARFIADYVKKDL